MGRKIIKRAQQKKNLHHMMQVSIEYMGNVGGRNHALLRWSPISGGTRDGFDLLFVTPC